MRITVLAHAHPGSDDVFDPVVGQVAAALRKGGQRVSILAVCDQPGRLLSGLKRRQPDLVFNLTSRKVNHGLSCIATVSLLEMIGVPCTGCGAADRHLQNDPTIVRKLLAADGIPIAPPEDLPTMPGNGRTLRVGVLGNRKAKALPAVDGGLNPISQPYNGAHQQAKYNGSPSHGEPMFVTLSTDERARVERVSLDACAALRVRDYGEVSVRLFAGMTPMVGGVHADCPLNEQGEYAAAAKEAGVDYVRLINQIADVALARAEEQPLHV